MIFEDDCWIICKTLHDVDLVTLGTKGEFVVY